ncbi:MAG: hypothetical protein VKI81_12530, partial [Synechococcaceae cyanobacterium]|nr:hypothetical protein [Synechococcaceae cyanobacterium]
MILILISADSTSPGLHIWDRHFLYLTMSALYRQAMIRQAENSVRIRDVLEHAKRGSASAISRIALDFRHQVGYGPPDRRQVFHRGPRAAGQVDHERTTPQSGHGPTDDGVRGGAEARCAHRLP